MREALENLIKRSLRVPPEPEPPVGAAGSVQVFRAAPGFFRYRLLGWGIGQAGAVFGIVASLAFLSFADGWSFSGWIRAVEGLAITFFMVQFLTSFLMLSLDYKYRWYMITDRSLRIREGVLKVQERTMTFSNVQNVSIKQGPVQRLFGISDLEVRTAGGGRSQGAGDAQQGLADNLHLGYFRGVANAAEIRDAILRHLRRLRTSGLGDPDDAAPASQPAAVEEPPPADDPAPASQPAAVEEPPPADDPAPAAEARGNGEAELLAAGREILSEARALRRAVA